MYALREWIGLIFKQAREELGYTEQYLADEVDIDIRTYKKIEAGISQPNFDVLERLIRLLYICPDIMVHAEHSDVGLAMDHAFRELLAFTPEEIGKICKSAIHIKSWYDTHPDEFEAYIERHKGIC